MNKRIASVVGASVLLATTASASAQRAIPTPPPPTAAASQTTQAPYASTNPDRGVEQSQPLFYIGKVPAVVWAPVQPNYNSKMNGTQAANALWNVDAF